MIAVNSALKKMELQLWFLIQEVIAVALFKDEEAIEKKENIAAML